MSAKSSIWKYFTNANKSTCIGCGKHYCNPWINIIQSDKSSEKKHENIYDNFKEETDETRNKHPAPEPAVNKPKQMKLEDIN